MEQIAVVVSLTFLVMISPGPDMVLVMRNTLVSGRSAGIWSSLGVLTGNAIHIIYCALGIGWLISQSIIAFSILKYAGAAYLIYLGISSLRAGASSIDSVAVMPRHRDRSWFLQGLFNNILNPKGTLFYLSVFTMVITPETSWGMTLILVMCMKTVSGAFWAVFVWALDQPVIRHLLQSSQQVVSRVFGAFLIGLGLRVAILDR